MTDNLKIAITAINKWLYYGWNYNLTPQTWMDANNETKTEYLPEFISDVKWTCNFQHMREKWHKATRTDDPNAYMVRFYAELDNNNQVLFLEWVIQHYNGERHINFADDE